MGIGLLAWLPVTQWVQASPYRFENWITGDGLPQNSINGLAQTPDGSLWMTTFDALVRFDGVRFTVFEHSNTLGSATNRLTALFVDREGTLWIGTEDSGMGRYRKSVFTTFTKDQGLPHNTVSQIQQDSQGTLVVVTGAGLARWAGDKCVLLPEPFLQPSQKIHYGRSGAQFPARRASQQNWTGLITCFPKNLKFTFTGWHRKASTTS